MGQEPSRRRFRGYSFTVADWEAILAKHGGKCVMCGTEDGLTVDHITPRHAFSGPNVDCLENIQPLCMPCNRKKGRRSMTGEKLLPVETYYMRMQREQAEKNALAEGARRAKRNRRRNIIECATILGVKDEEAMAIAASLLREILRVKKPGVQNMTTTTLDRLCRFFGVRRLEDLIEYVPDAKPTPPDT